MSGSLAGFTAQITNSTNTVTTGALTMQETSGATTCNSTDGTNNTTNTFTCATINKYGGGTLIPGSGTTSTASVVIKNTGSVTANTATLNPQACTQSKLAGSNGSATDLCAKLLLTVTYTVNGTTGTPVTLINAVPLSTLAASYSFAPVAAGTTTNFTFTVSFPTTGTTAGDNLYQGLQASQPLIWNYAS